MEGASPSQCELLPNRRHHGGQLRLLSLLYRSNALCSSHQLCSPPDMSVDKTGGGRWSGLPLHELWESKKVVLPGIGIQIAVGIFWCVCVSYLCLRFSRGFAVNKQPWESCLDDTIKRTSLSSAGINIPYNRKHEGITERCSGWEDIQGAILMQFNSISSPQGVPHGAQRDILLVQKKKKQEGKQRENFCCHNKNLT